MNWVLHPLDGIESEGIKIAFGQPRSAVRQALASACQPLRQNEAYLDEDDFHSRDESTWIRVRYDTDDAVQDIECLNGTLRYEDIDLHDHTTLAQVKQNLQALAFTFRPTEWLGDGWDCVALGINVASHEDIGGVGDEMEWVILSSVFRD